MSNHCTHELHYRRDDNSPTFHAYVWMQDGNGRRISPGRKYSGRITGIMESERGHSAFKGNLYPDGTISFMLTRGGDLATIHFMGRKNGGGSLRGDMYNHPKISSKVGEFHLEASRESPVSHGELVHRLKAGRAESADRII